MFVGESKAVTVSGSGLFEGGTGVGLVVGEVSTGIGWSAPAQAASSKKLLRMATTRTVFTGLSVYKTRSAPNRTMDKPYAEAVPELKTLPVLSV